MNDNKSPFRYKKVGKDKYEYDFMSWSEWEDLMKESDMDKKSIKQIMKDLVENLKFYLKHSKELNQDQFKYDRFEFLKMDYNLIDDEDEEDIYDTDIQTLTTLIFQIKDGHIIVSNDEGRDIRNNKLIWEKQK